jgi:hypothetical protein
MMQPESLLLGPQNQYWEALKLSAQQPQEARVAWLAEPRGLLLEERQ